MATLRALATSEGRVVVLGRKVRAKSIALALAGVRSFDFAQDPRFGNVKHDPDYLVRFGSELAAFDRLMADDESRATLASVVRQRVTGDHGYLAIAPYPQYRHPVVSPRPGDWVIDGGAADGATSLAFARAAGPSGRVLAVEADPFNVPGILVRRVLSRHARAPIRPVWAALGAKVEAVGFQAGRGGSSRISDTSRLKVPGTTLDRLAERFDLSDRGLISLDIEGAEIAALEGGRTMLRRLRPQLQISVYHRKTDLFEIPLWIAAHLDGYRFYMGHHDAYHSETDLYACPEERLKI